MTQFALDHHTCLGSSTNTENFAESWIFPAMQLSISWAWLSGLRLGRGARVVGINVEAFQVALKYILHVRLENMQRCIGFSEELLTLPHPVLVSLLLLFEVKCT